MPDEERAICARLRQFRLESGLSQEEFARLVGMERTLWASYEYGRSLLNYPAAFRIIARMGVNPWWLAEGHEPKKDIYAIRYPEPHETGYGPRTPFSLVFSSLIKVSILRSQVAWLRSPAEQFPISRLTEDALGRLRAEEIWSRNIRGWLAHLPDGKLNEFLDLLHRAGNEICERCLSGNQSDHKMAAQRSREVERLKWKQLAARAESGRESNVTFKVDTSAKSDMVARVKAFPKSWPELRRQILKATSAKGSKAELARQLGVARQAVDKWLNQGVEPSAEIALRLLAWVTAREAKQ